MAKFLGQLMVFPWLNLCLFGEEHSFVTIATLYARDNFTSGRVLNLIHSFMSINMDIVFQFDWNRTQLQTSTIPPSSALTPRFRDDSNPFYNI